MANRKRKCKWCKEFALVESGAIFPGGFFCCKEHAIEFAIKKSQDDREKRIKKAKQEESKKLKERKIQLRDRAWYLKECQKHFNKFIRLRDKDLPCISCGRYHQGQYHAGHYKTVGASPELRFEELNVHKQCAPCNNHLSGNIVNYRVNLIDRIGISKVEWLEGHHEPKKYTIEQLKEMIEYYKAKCKEIEKLK